jgi:WD40 repeat protein
VSLAFSPGGHNIATGSWDKTARVWETASGKPLGQALVHRDRVAAVAFSPDGKYVVTGSWDQTARVWESTTGKPVGQALMHRGIIGSSF